MDRKIFQIKKDWCGGEWWRGEGSGSERGDPGGEAPWAARAPPKAGVAASCFIKTFVFIS